jgi:hypothetical protein
VPREAAGQGFSLVAVDEAVVPVAFRLVCDTSRHPAFFVIAVINGATAKGGADGEAVHAHDLAREGRKRGRVRQAFSSSLVLVWNAKNERQLRDASSQGFNGPNSDDYLEGGIVKSKFLPA